MTCGTFADRGSSPAWYRSRTLLKMAGPTSCTSSCTGAHQFQAGDGVDVVHAVPRLGQVRGLDDSGVGVEAEGADAQAAAAGGVSDGVGLLVVHGVTVGSQAT